MGRNQDTTLALCRLQVKQLTQSEFTKLRVPNLYDLRADPFERVTSSIHHADWQAHRVFIQVPAQAIVAKMLGPAGRARMPNSNSASVTLG